MPISIVGAGPSGSSAAIFLAKNGFEKIKLYERSPNKRKPCGGGLTSKLFETYGGLLKGLELNAFRKVVFDVNKTVMEVYYKKPVIKIVNRLAFDSHLRNLARSEGVELVKKAVEPRELKDDIVVDARGVDFKNINYITRVALCKLKHRDLTFIYRPSLIGLGYFWIFPINDNVADVGCGGFINTFKFPLNTVFERFIKNIKARPVKSMGYPMCVGKKIKNLVEKSNGRIVAKVGERAGLVNPLTGEGIYHAIKSSEILTECIKKDEITSYEIKLEKEFGKEFSFSRRFLAIKKFLPNFLVSSMIEHSIKSFSPDVIIKKSRSIAWSSAPA